MNFNKCLRQYRDIIIPEQPVLGDSLGGHTQNFRGQVRGMDPRQDKEACILAPYGVEIAIDHKMESLFVLNTGPTDKKISGGCFPYCRPEA